MAKTRKRIKFLGRALPAEIENAKQDLHKLGWAEITVFRTQRDAERFGGVDCFTSKFRIEEIEK